MRTTLKNHRLSLVSLIAATLVLAFSTEGQASGPTLANDPAMQINDLWAWQDSAGTITILTSWGEPSVPGAGPNYKKWVTYPQGVYEIHLDTDGDGVEDRTYQFRFSNIDDGEPTSFRVIAPPGYQGPSQAGATSQKLRQTYTVSLIHGPRRATPPVGTTGSFAVTPPSTGPTLTRGRAGAFNASIAGTVSVTNGSNSVTGTATTGLSALVAGQTIAFANQAGVPYSVQSVSSNTLTLASPFFGATNAATVLLTRGVDVPTPGSDYEAVLAAPATQSLSGTTGFNGERAFVGPRADAFYGDVGALLDRLKIRTFGGSPGVAGSGARGPDVGQYGGGFNQLSGRNVGVIALQIPISQLGGSFSMSAFGPGYIGVWASASRSKLRVLPVNGSNGIGTGVDNRDLALGSFVQVSRRGNPLVSELFIPYDKQDAWNGDVPSKDGAHWAQYFSNPEPAALLSAIYGVGIPPPPRNDLQVLFAPDTLKVQTASPPLTASSPAFLGGAVPLAGRTLGDDTVDLLLKIASGLLVEDSSLGGLGLSSIYGMPAFFPPSFSATGIFGPATLNNLLGDGVDYGVDGASCGLQVTPTTFPYLPTPWDGEEINNSDFQSPRHN